MSTPPCVPRTQVAEVRAFWPIHSTVSAATAAMATATVNVIDIGNSQQEGHVNLMSKLRHVCTKLVGSSDGQSADQGGLHDSTLQDGHEEGKQAAADVQLSGRDERTRNELLTSPRTSLLQPIPAAQGPIYELSHALQVRLAMLSIHVIGPLLHAFPVLECGCQACDCALLFCARHTCAYLSSVHMRMQYIRAYAGRQHTLEQTEAATR